MHLRGLTDMDDVMPLDLPPAPEPFRLFVAILACTHPPDEYRSRFHKSEIFFHQIASENKGVIIPHQVGASWPTSKATTQIMGPRISITYTGVLRHYSPRDSYKCLKLNSG